MPPNTRTRRGPKTLLTDESHKAIVEAMERGHYLRTACGLAKISWRNAKRWRARGEVDFANGEDTEYARFYVATEEAKAKEIDRALIEVRAAATTETDGDPNLAKWFLERREQESWGGRPNAARELQAGIQAHLSKILEVISAAARIEVLAAHRALMVEVAGSGGGEGGTNDGEPVAH